MIQGNEMESHMTGKTQVGIIGCGTISEIYLKNLTGNFQNVEVVACADLFVEKAEQAAAKFGVAKACSVEELLADASIQIVLNLTIPVAHHEINRQVLLSGKHLYCEKPMSLSLEEANEIVQLARERNLIAGSAPDTFLGSGHQTARKLLDEGKIGRPTSFTANLVSPGHELWHPNPAFYYQKGGGPMMDMGPYYITALVHLFGPIQQISCVANASRTQRDIYGQLVDVEVPTHYAGIMKFVSGIVGNINMSFDVWHSNLPGIEVFGTKGVLSVPDPNMFGGPVRVFDGMNMSQIVNAVEGPYVNRLMRMHTCAAECEQEAPLAFPSEGVPRSNMRGFGVAEMAGALATGRKCRLDGDFSRHVVEALLAFDSSVRENKPYVMTTTCERPESMPDGLELWAVE